MKWFLIFVPRLLCLFLLGNQHGSALVDQLQEQENVLQECVRQMESAETTRAALVYQLKEALHDQVLFFFSKACISNAKFCNFVSLWSLNLSGIEA